MIKRSIQQENIIFVNIYVPNIEAPEYIKQRLTKLKGETNNTVMVGDFKTALSAVYKSSRQKISKETLYLNDVRPDGLNGNLYYIPCNSSRIHFLLKMEHLPG